MKIDKHEFKIAEKTVEVFPSSKPNCPIVYLNTFSNEGENVFKTLQSMNCPDFSLVAISGLKWDHDMAPWDVPPISKDDTPCTGGANDYLKLLTGEIVPRSEDIIGDFSWRGLAGYSLAGLFAIYSLYNTDIFSRIASMSGSLWFPGIVEYIKTHKILKLPECVYFSLGDLECKTTNPYLKTVQKNTEEIEKIYAGYGIDTVFKLNSGNHYQHALERTAEGILWILNQT